MLAVQRRSTERPFSAAFFLKSLTNVHIISIFSLRQINFKWIGIGNNQTIRRIEMKKFGAQKGKYCTKKNKTKTEEKIDEYWVFDTICIFLLHNIYSCRFLSNYLRRSLNTLLFSIFFRIFVLFCAVFLFRFAFCSLWICSVCTQHTRITCIFILMIWYQSTQCNENVFQFPVAFFALFYISHSVRA